MFCTVCSVQRWYDTAFSRPLELWVYMERVTGKYRGTGVVPLPAADRRPRLQ